ncbi:MAG: hypothetical protein ACI8RZ_002098 [Myxococcota bacterium]|jgi:hypothetical protein
MLVLLLTLLVALAAPQRPVSIQSIEDAEAISDPRALNRAGDHWLAEDADLARALFTRAQEQEEITRYLRYREGLKEALILERLGEHEAAAVEYRAGFESDIHTTLLVLRILSHHPDREALFAEGVAQVKALVEQAKAGENAQIYTTKKGAPRYLEVIPDDEALDALRQGTLKYCYIDNLDLSAVPAEEIPEVISLSRCVVGSIRIPDKAIGTLNLRAIVLGPVDIGKTWSGAVNKSVLLASSRFENIMFRESVFLGPVNAQGVNVGGRVAYFVMSIFEDNADFRDTAFSGMADFRFSVFGHGASFKGSRMSDAVYFGGSRYLDDTSFYGMYSEQDVFFNSVTFEGAAAFDRCEWTRGATFENSLFKGPVTFHSSTLGGRLNMSRTIVEDTLLVKEMSLSGMDFIGSWLQGDAAFTDVVFDGKVRFSLDDITRAQHLESPTELLAMYRDYQGDKDAEEPLTTASSYGVEHVDDLIARIDGNISFANSMFKGFVIFERVQFGQPGKKTSAEFYNTQFKGESHFERTEWFSDADFTTIFGNELSFYEATFHRMFSMDDANVFGRVNMADAVFTETANLSFYEAEILTLQIDRAQLERDDGTRRMFYDDCTAGRIDREDIRIKRLVRRRGELTDAEIKDTCYSRLLDEYILLKQSFGDRGMVPSEDWSYWWFKHHELMQRIRHGETWSDRAGAVLSYPLFELAFGWGVRLSNLGFTSLFITVLFAVLYRVFCPETVVAYGGNDVPMKEIPWHGLLYISLQTLGAFNTGWDFGEDEKHVFQYLNTVETFLGIVILTFFVGAYTRMILA